MVYNSKEIVEDIGKCHSSPSKYVMSEGERIIKQLAQKQKDTSVSLERELLRPNQFEKATELLPVTSFTSGTSSLKQFDQYAEKARAYEQIKSQEASNEHEVNREIEYGLCVQSSVNRHQKELGLCVKPESQETKLFKFFLSCQPTSTDTKPLSHPLNNLKQLERETFGHLDSPKIPSLSKRRKKMRKLIEECQNDTDIYSGKLSNSNDLSKVPSTMWDKRTAPISISKSKMKHTYSCKPQTLYTIKNSEIVCLNSVKTEPKQDFSSNSKLFIGTSECTSDVKVENRLTVEEIRRIPRFQNYEKGEPNKNLYLKNLAPNVTENDLISLFSRFQNDNEPRITYRLMTSGKMRGQAFVTLCDIERASLALECINGCILKNKPIIIQYAKSKQ